MWFDQTKRGQLISICVAGQIFEGTFYVICIPE